MPIRDKFRKAMGRGSSTSNSPSVSASASQDNSGSTTPALTESLSMSPIDRENLTIDPRDNPLTQVETNATAKKKSALAKLRSAMKKEDPYKDWPEHIYKPHEVPRPKYRRPVDPDHAETLNAYSLRSAFAEIRRRSYLSSISPGGSRLPSRRGSIASRLGPSAAPSRSQSIAAVALDEAEDDDDISNVGLSRHPTNSKTAAIPIRPRGDTVTTSSNVPDLVQSSSIDSDDTDSILNTSQTVTLGDNSRAGGVNAHGSQFSKPFDEEELTRAITSKLVVEN